MRSNKFYLCFKDDEKCSNNCNSGESYMTSVFAEKLNNATNNNNKGAGLTLVEVKNMIKNTPVPKSEIVLKSDKGVQACLRDVEHDFTVVFPLSCTIDEQRQLLGIANKLFKDLRKKIVHIESGKDLSRTYADKNDYYTKSSGQQDRKKRNAWIKKRFIELKKAKHTAYDCADIVINELKKKSFGKASPISSVSYILSIVYSKK